MGYGTPLQYSCLENPMDRGAWWAPVRGVVKSQMWLKQLSRHTLHLLKKLKLTPSTKKISGFTGEFYQAFKEKFFQKTEKEGLFLYWCYEAKK